MGSSRLETLCEGEVFHNWAKSRDLLISLCIANNAELKNVQGHLGQYPFAFSYLLKLT